MNTRRALLVAVASFALTTMAAVSAPGATAAPRQPRQLTPAQLRARLLTLAQLPKGTQPYQVTFDDPTSSNKPACLNTLDGMDSPKAPPSSTQAQAGFVTQSQTGPWILETLRSYPGQGAIGAFNADTATLAGCQTFTLNWPTPVQPSVEYVTTHGPVGAGNQSWTATITVVPQEPGYGIPEYDVQYFIRVGDSTLNLEITWAYGPLTVAQYKPLAVAAAERLAG
jgi:hypothetical protein